MFLDLVDNPDMVHRAIGRLVEGHIAVLKSLEEQEALSVGNLAHYTGSGGTGGAGADVRESVRCDLVGHQPHGVGVGCRGHRRLQRPAPSRNTGRVRLPAVTCVAEHSPIEIADAIVTCVAGHSPIEIADAVAPRVADHPSLETGISFYTCFRVRTGAGVRGDILASNAEKHLPYQKE